jgi:hypothetical protein
VARRSSRPPSPPRVASVFAKRWFKQFRSGGGKCPLSLDYSLSIALVVVATTVLQYCILQAGGASVVQYFSGAGGFPGHGLVVAVVVVSSRRWSCIYSCACRFHACHRCMLFFGACCKDCVYSTMIGETHSCRRLVEELFAIEASKDDTDDKRTFVPQFRSAQPCEISKSPLVR